MNVLLVDDSRTMRHIHKRILSQLAEFDFFEAGDGLEALQVMADTPEGFGLIIIDWSMPNMDGLTLVNRIRETDKATPLLMASTESDKARVMEAIRAGVNSYVIKPFTPEVLIEKVKRTLDQRKVA